jgi:hypothetical protein
MPASPAPNLTLMPPFSDASAPDGVTADVDRGIVILPWFTFVVRLGPRPAADAASRQWNCAVLTAGRRRHPPDRAGGTDGMLHGIPVEALPNHRRIGAIPIEPAKGPASPRAAASARRRRPAQTAPTRPPSHAPGEWSSAKAVALSGYLRSNERALHGVEGGREGGGGARRVSSSKRARDPSANRRGPPVHDAAVVIRLFRPSAGRSTPISPSDRTMAA